MRDIMAGESWRGEQLGYMRQELLSLKTGVDKGYWDLQNEVDRLTGDIKHQEAVLRWYARTVRAILDAAKDGEPDGFTVRFKHGEPDEVVDGKPSPGYLLRLAGSRYGDTEQRLTWFLQKLVNHEYLTSEQARQFDVTPPIHEAKMERLREEREKARQWQEDFDGVVEAVAKHVVKVGKPSEGYARRRAVQLWNLVATDSRRSDDNMRQWIHKLHGEKLLPAGAWLRGQGRHAMRKLLEAVS